MIYEVWIFFFGGSAGSVSKDAPVIIKIVISGATHESTESGTSIIEDK